jgi:hypothetical protein
MKLNLLIISTFFVVTAYAGASADFDLYESAMRGNLGHCTLNINTNPANTIGVSLFEFGRPALCGPQGATQLGQLVGNSCWLSKNGYASNPEASKISLARAIRKYMEDGHCVDSSVDPLSLQALDLVGTYRYDGAEGATVTLKQSVTGSSLDVLFKDWGSDGNNFAGEATLNDNGVLLVISARGKFTFTPVSEGRLNYKFNDTAIFRANRGQFLNRMP